LPCVFAPQEVRAIIAELGAVLEGSASPSVLRTESGAIYGARNLLDLWPSVADIWRVPVLVDAITKVLGARFGLVRGLYFDKPPEQTWALPWHQDRAIMVRDNRFPSEHFSRPTCKAGMPHVDAPDWLLETMLTLRIHLDQMTESNGPLQVLPGSHRKQPTARAAVSILGQAGDVLLMRPLLSHSSASSHPNATAHRRVVHLEFSATELLPDDYAWRHFIV
jgi:hypothetical protein